MAFSNGYIFTFATTICVVCSLAVSATATGLRDKQELNKLRDLRGNILQALDLADASSIDGEAIDRLWSEKVRLALVDPSGKPLKDADADVDGDGDADADDAEAARVAAKGSGNAPSVLAVYQRVEGSSVSAHAIPVHGAGLWGPVSGYLAVDSDGTTLMGATFDAPKETPGLGAEIMGAKFKDQWKGKKLFDSTGKATPIRVAKGSAAQLHPKAIDHWVDGVSGATITCRGVTAMLEEGVSFYQPYLSRIRAGGGQ